MNEGIKLSNAMEDYLREIYLLTVDGQEVRVTDIALVLGISKPSVNKAVNTLKEQGYILHEHYGRIELTDEGRIVAEDLLETNKVVRKFLEEVLGVNAETAGIEAHQMEHILSKGTRKKLKRYTKKTLKK